MAKTDSVLQASVGDRLVVRGHHVGEAIRDGEIIAVLGEHGHPPYLVRWEDGGRVSRLYPGSDAYVQHFDHEAAGPAPVEAPGTGGLADRLPSAADWEAAVPPRDS